MKNLLQRAKQAIRTRLLPDSASPMENERRRLRRLARYQETETNLPGFSARIPDGPSFLSVWTEVFDNGIYDFIADNQTPRILDCGANVGISCLFFKRRFPGARIMAFEPDPKIFGYLKEMMADAKITDIELIPKAIWSAATTLQFFSEGSDAGRINELSSAKTITVETVRLRDYLLEPVDFLKIDIEGAETEVLLDSASLLKNVKHLFVEYHSFSSRPQTLNELLNVIRSAGFRVQIHPMMMSQKPFIKIEEYLGMDLQLNIFASRH